MTTTTTKKPAASKKSGRTAQKKASVKTVAATETLDEITGEPVPAKGKRPKKSSEPKAPPAPHRITTIRGATTIHHGDDADLATIERVLPTIDALNANARIVPYLLACSQGAMHLSVALPGQNLSYTDLPGLTMTIDCETLDVRLDASFLGALDVDLIETGGLVLLEALHAPEGEAVTTLGWRKDWEPHLAMMAGVVADAHAATRT